MANENNLPATAGKRQLPTFQELAGDPGELFKRDQLNLLLNQPPREGWLKKHPTVSGHKYLPVDKHEFLMTAIFGEWQREIKDIKQLANAVVAIVRVHYKDPITGDWKFHDGVGAVDIQIKSGKSFDVDNITSAAVQRNAPAAASYAFKDACECLGKLFGRDLGKTGTMEFSGLYREPDAPPASTPTATNTPSENGTASVNDFTEEIVTEF